jgi:peroxiredoxin (alkyl hydroperoxide reductase subunit C)
LPCGFFFCELKLLKKEDYIMGLVGKKAPDFTAGAVINGSTILDNYTFYEIHNKYKVLFFYPLDFTFVCPTELHAFQEKLSQFSEKNTEVIGVSVDSKHTHFAWLNTPKENGGIQGVTYPLVADLTKSIAKDYDVLKEDEGVAYRGLFVIDKDNIVRHQLVNDLPLGRNVDEALRIVEALQFHEKNGDVCPANWAKGDQALSANSDGIKAYFKSTSA